MASRAVQQWQAAGPQASDEKSLRRTLRRRCACLHCLDIDAVHHVLPSAHKLALTYLYITWLQLGVACMFDNLKGVDWGLRQKRETVSSG
jgi:hypothetical protein